jgi:hypothetical protein
VDASWTRPKDDSRLRLPEEGTEHVTPCGKAAAAFVC